jgi:hypothetical protein
MQRSSWISVVPGLARLSHKTVRLAVALIAVSAGTALAQINVPGTSNPYLSGLPNGFACCSGDVAPAQSPVQVVSIPVTPGQVLTFSATGAVYFEGSVPLLPPDGGFIFTTASSDGISGATWPASALVGVFLDDSLPTATAAPADLDFSGSGVGTSFTTLSPALKQVFFIGDGRTGSGSGAVQHFVVPAGATRLFLGVADGVGWFNNPGSFDVTVAVLGTGPGAPAAIAVPTLSDAMLVLLVLTITALAFGAVRRR